MKDLLDKEGFSRRHLGSDEEAQRQMLSVVDAASVEALVHEVVPRDILLKQPLALDEPKTENEALAEISAHAFANELWRNFIGTG